MNRNYLLSGVAVLLVLGLAAFGYEHFAAMPLLSPHGTVGYGERYVILLTFGLSGVVVFPVFFMLGYFAWRYREGNHKSHPLHNPDWDHRGVIAESVWWAVPTLIIAVLAVVAWKSSYRFDPYKPLPSTQPALTVQVVALDWKWLFIYPQQGIATLNMLEIPAGTPVHFELTADAPMNSFWVPALGGQLMAMPGMSNQLNLEADSTGTYDGFSANISGAGFSGMNFKVNAVSPEEFQQWTAAQQMQNHPLTTETYAELAQPSQNNAPATYTPVVPNLYGAIIGKYMAPADMNAMPGMNMSGMQM